MSETLLLRCQDYTVREGDCKGIQRSLPSIRPALTAPPSRVDSSFAPGGVIPSGERVFFRSAERLASDDGDGFIDVYVRDLVGKKRRSSRRATPAVPGKDVAAAILRRSSAAPP